MLYNMTWHSCERLTNAWVDLLSYSKIWSKIHVVRIPRLSICAAVVLPIFSSLHLLPSSSSHALFSVSFGQVCHSTFFYPIPKHSPKISPRSFPWIPLDSFAFLWIPLDSLTSHFLDSQLFGSIVNSLIFGSGAPLPRWRRRRLPEWVLLASDDKQISQLLHVLFFSIFLNLPPSFSIFLRLSPSFSIFHIFLLVHLQYHSFKWWKMDENGWLLPARPAPLQVSNKTSNH